MTNQIIYLLTFKAISTNPLKLQVFVDSFVGSEN